VSATQATLGSIQSGRLGVTAHVRRLATAAFVLAIVAGFQTRGGSREEVAGAEPQSLSQLVASSNIQIPSTSSVVPLPTKTDGLGNILRSLPDCVPGRAVDHLSQYPSILACKSPPGKVTYYDPRTRRLLPPKWGRDVENPLAAWLAPVASAHDRCTGGAQANCPNVATPRHGIDPEHFDRASVATAGSYAVSDLYSYAIAGTGGDNSGSLISATAMPSTSASGEWVLLGSTIAWMSNQSNFSEVGWYHWASGLGPDICACPFTDSLDDSSPPNGVLKSYGPPYTLTTNTNYAFANQFTGLIDGKNSWTAYFWCEPVTTGCPGTSGWVVLDVRWFNSFTSSSAGLDPGIEGTRTLPPFVTYISGLQQLRSGSLQAVGPAAPNCNNPGSGQQCAFNVNNECYAVDLDTPPAEQHDVFWMGKAC